MTITGPNDHQTSNGNSFDTALRFELADDEGRALAASYAISAAIGTAFLLLVHFGPTVAPVVALPAGDPISIIVGTLQPNPRASDRPVTATDAHSPRSRRSGSAAGSAAAAISSAFGGTSAGLASLVEDARGILNKVAVSSGVGGIGAGGKVVLGAGSGGLGSTAPVRGGVSGGAGGAAPIGGVSGSSGLGRAAVTVGAPQTIPVAGLPQGGGGDAGEVGTFVRARSAQLQWCYQRGIGTDAGLAGSITLALTLSANGTVSAAEVTRRTWSGVAVTEAEACIVRLARAWRVSSAASGTYSLPLSFTR